MMRRFIAVVALLLAPTTSIAASPPPPPVPQPDTVTATGSTDVMVNINVDAHSGPLGEDPGGVVSFGTTVVIKGQVFAAGVGGPVTCLNVAGNGAVIGIDATLVFAYGTVHIGPVRVEVVDNGGSGLDQFSAYRWFPPADCSGGPPTGYQLNGRATVVDAQPLPTSKVECRDGRFALFGFKSQGQCIRYVTQS